MKLLIALLLVLVGLATPAFAQAHFCDTQAPTSGTVPAGAPVTLQICTLPADTPNVSTFAVYDNGARLVVTFSKGTTSGQSNKTEWDWQFTAPSAAGLHTYQEAVINATGEGPKSVPFALTVQLPLPGAPLNPTIHP